MNKPKPRIARTARIRQTQFVRVLLHVMGCLYGVVYGCDAVRGALEDGRGDSGVFHDVVVDGTSHVYVESQAS